MPYEAPQCRSRKAGTWTHLPLERLPEAESRCCGLQPANVLSKYQKEPRAEPCTTPMVPGRCSVKAGRKEGGPDAWKGVCPHDPF